MSKPMAAKLRMGGLARTAASKPESVDFTPIASNLPFTLYLVFTVCTFLSLPNWFHALRPLRPTVLLLGALILWLFIHRDSLQGRLQSQISRRLLSLLVYIALSLPFVEFPGSVVKNNLDVFIRAIAFFFFTVLIVDTDRRLRIFVGVFVICCLIRIMDPIRLNLTEGYLGSQTHLGHGEFAGRLSGAPWDIVNPNGYAFVIITGFLFAHFLMGGASRWWLRLAYWLMVPAMMFGLVQSMSRSGFIGLLAGLAVILFYSKRRLLLVAIAVAGSVVAVSNMTDIQKERYLSLFESDVRGADTAAARIDGSLTELRLWLDKPVFGWGLGTSAEARYTVMGKYKIAHNMYAEVLLELGAIGFLFFMSVLVGIWQTCLRAMREMSLAIRGDPAPDSSRYYTQLGRVLQAWFIACFVFSFAQYGLSEPYWYLFAGLTVAWQRCATTKQAEINGVTVSGMDQGKAARRSRIHGLRSKA